MVTAPKVCPYKRTDGEDLQMISLMLMFTSLLMCFECMRVRKPVTQHAQCMRKGGRGAAC